MNLIATGHADYRFWFVVDLVGKEPEYFFDEVIREEVVEGDDECDGQEDEGADDKYE